MTGFSLLIIIAVLMPFAQPLEDLRICLTLPPCTVPAGHSRRAGRVWELLQCSVAKVAAMSSKASSPVVDVLVTSSFVNAVTTSGSNQSSVWNKSSGVSFVVFMVIGFCATLGLIAILVTAFLLIRRQRNRRRAALEQAAELADTMPEPKELYVVVHPGGTADLAHKEDKEPRKRVLRNKEVELSSAVITFGTIPAYREDNDGVCLEPANDARRKEAREDVLHSSCLDGAIEVFPLEDTAQGVSSRSRSMGQKDKGPPADGAASASSVVSSSLMTSASSSLEEPEVPAKETQQVRDPGGPGNLSARAVELLLTHRSTASEEYYEDVLLLTQRYTRS